MPRGIKTSKQLVNKCIKLRKEKRLSLPEITSQTGVAKGTLSLLLAEHRLSQAEVNAKTKATKATKTWEL